MSSASKAKTTRISTKAPGRKTGRAANRIASDGNGKAAAKAKTKPKEKRQVVVPKKIVIPELVQKETTVVLVGTTPLMMNNKQFLAGGLATRYDPDGPKTKTPQVQLTPEQRYAGSFYVLADSKYEAPHEKARYGVPASGLKKCFDSAIRLTGISNNTEVSIIQRSYKVMPDVGPFVLLRHKGFHMDQRTAQPRDSKTPQWRYRAYFHVGWELRVRIRFNPLMLDEANLVNLIAHAGEYIGLCELRPEKKQSECGQFAVLVGK